MSDEETTSESIIGNETRRSFVKKGALASGAAALGLSSTGTTVAHQEENDDDDAVLEDEQFRVATFQNNFRGGARFIITSDVVEWVPNVPPNLGGPFTGYNTHFATYLNTAGRFPIFIADGAELDAQFDQEEGFFVDPDQSFGENEFVQPQVYALENKFSFYEDTDRIVTAYANPLEEDAENAIFAAEGLNTEEEFNEFLF